MGNPTINAPEEKVSAPVQINTEALAAANRKPTQAVTAPADKQPCNWELSWEDAVLVGKNIITGREFRGSKEDFRELMKG